MTTTANTAAAVFDHLEQIAATASKNDKERLVAAGLDTPLFERVIKAALDPFITYGIRKVPEQTTPGTATLDDERWWQVLDGLASRKLAGNAARDAVQLAAEQLDTPSWQLFKRIVLTDLRAGFSDSTVNKARKGLLPSFPYMRCSLPKDSNIDDEAFWAKGAFSQEKADGRFANVNHDEAGAVWISSRQGTPMPLDQLDDFVADVQALLKRGTQTHGELVVFQAGALMPREQGNGVISHIDSGGALNADQRLVFLAWDQIPLEAVKPKGKYEVPYIDRLRALVAQLGGSKDAGVRLIPTRAVASRDEANEHCRQLLKLGKEGTIVKCADAIWRDGTSKDQVKFKLEVPVELRVTGFNEGTGKNVGALGSFQCESECGQLKTDVSGRGDAMRADVWANRDAWLGAVITVKSNLVMKPSKAGDPHSLFLPIYVERRTDKDQADTLAGIKAQFEAAIHA